MGSWSDHALRVFAPRNLVVWAIFSVAVSIAGPFGTFEGMSWPMRLAYWAGLIGLSIPLHHLIRTTLDDRGRALNYWLRSLLIGLLFSVVFTPLVWIASKPLADQGMVTLVPIWIMALVTMLGSGVVRTVQKLWHLDTLEQGRLALEQVAAEKQNPDRTAPPAAVVPRLIRRLDEDKRGTVQHLSVRDHYVVVQTDRGQSTLLMRFADALGELDGTEGMRVHRSHWVAKSAVAAVERHAGKMHLRLTDGRVVPVSRSYRDEVEPPPVAERAASE